MADDVPLRSDPAARDRLSTGQLVDFDQPAFAFHPGADDRALANWAADDTAQFRFRDARRWASVRAPPPRRPIRGLRRARGRIWDPHPGPRSADRQARGAAMSDWRADVLSVGGTAA